VCVPQAAVAELTQRKQELMYELTSYHNMRNPELPQPEANLIPNSTRVDSFVVVNQVRSLGRTRLCTVLHVLRAQGF
jgi:hypothetical protein